MATTAGGYVAFATPADAATGPTATLSSGIVTVTGTADRDVISITLDSDRLAIDFGANDTVDAQFGRSRFQRVQVLAAGGDDGVGFTGTGEVPVTISGGAGNDGIGVVGNFGQTGEGDAPTTISGNGGNDGLFVVTRKGAVEGVLRLIADRPGDRPDGVVTGAKTARRELRAPRADVDAGRGSDLGLESTGERSPRDAEVGGERADRPGERRVTIQLGECLPGGGVGEAAHQDGDAWMRALLSTMPATPG